ncbi:MAG: polysaccharide deacetylase family protein [Thermodesulfobacteriota bacterium]
MSEAISAIAVAFCVGAALFYLPYVFRKVGEYRLQRYCRTHGILVLSYDDGPGPRLTSQLLDLLARDGVKATFFFLGFRGRRHPQLVRRASQEGHEIGVHGQRHLNAWRLSPWRGVADLREGHESLAPEMSDAPIFRPPYGKLTIFQWLEMRRRGMRAGWWTIALGDTCQKAVRPRVAALVKGVEQMGGGIVLLHDYDRKAALVDQEEYVLAATRQLIEMARHTGMEVLPLGVLLTRLA